MKTVSLHGNPSGPCYPVRGPSVNSRVTPQISYLTLYFPIITGICDLQKRIIGTKRSTMTIEKNRSAMEVLLKKCPYTIKTIPIVFIQSSQLNLIKGPLVFELGEQLFDDVKFIDNGLFLLKNIFNRIL